MLIAEPTENYSTGYIKLFRSLSNKSWYNKSEYVHLWIHILIKASYKESEFWFNGKPIILRKGQFITGRDKLSSETGLHSSKIERILNHFEKIEHQIEQQKGNKNRIITVLNWESYQSCEQQTEQQLNNKRTTTEQQLNTYNKNNNSNKENKVKNIKTYSEQSPEVELSKLLFNLILNNNPIAKQPNIQSWAKHIDLMIRIDNRSIDDIKGAIIFSQQDSFWHTNILSTEKLRKQFDQLLLKARNNGNGKNNQIREEVGSITGQFFDAVD